jgi:uncharacterized protein with NAD-binding domain and iron-sulfur cluster
VPTMAETSGMSRRRFLAASGATAALLTADAFTRRAGAQGRSTVAVLGGGIAGLTAAHELALRGFDVTVYERRAFGGKARSMGVPSTGVDGRQPLPGEHGYRIFFGFYQHLPDTMQRIPFASNPRGVFDNLVGVPEVTYSRAAGRDITVPVGLDPQRIVTPQQARDSAYALLVETELPPDAAAHIADRLAVFFSSCDERRIGQWDAMSWDDFIGADRYTDDYRRAFAEPWSHMLQASTADNTSAKFVGQILEWMIYGLAGRGTNGPLDRIFDAPTNEAFVDPWVAELDRLGVRLRLGQTVSRLHCERGRLVGATVEGPQTGRHRVAADWYVCALPVERARGLFDRAVLSSAPELVSLSSLNTAWMNGIQFYLRERPPMPRGHVLYLDSPWMLSSINQAQFWKQDFATAYGDGITRDCLSVDISDWVTPGVLYGRPARDLRPNEIAAEAWEQIKRHVNDSGETRLTDDLLLSWHLDPGIVERGGRLDSEDPLVLPSVGAWSHQPDSATTIPNLALAGDYVRGEFEMANMEAACESGRRATNTILERAGSRETPSALFTRYRPPEWEPFKLVDEQRYRAGLPNALEAGVLTPT